MQNLSDGREDCIPVRMVLLKTKREEQDTILLHL